jgi:hypothetical protein
MDFHFTYMGEDKLPDRGSGLGLAHLDLDLVQQTDRSLGVKPMIHNSSLQEVWISCYKAHRPSLITEIPVLSILPPITAGFMTRFLVTCKGGCMPTDITFRYTIEYMKVLWLWDHWHHLIALVLPVPFIKCWMQKEGCQ